MGRRSRVSFARRLTIRTARKLGIATVAVYSDADREALHVKMADEAVRIGPAPSSQSYLVIDRILEAAKTTGADAIHPGYGFLSENSNFAEALKAAGVAFIGPPPVAIEAMGDKITSKKIAASAGVSTVPGHMGLIADAEEAAKISSEIGYPVMIKASAGGGGKGMRIAWNDAEAREGFQSSKNEAKSSFGDDRIFIEKFVTQPRHIEIQVLGDQHGTLLYLGERECSIQRRNQKVIEEAPSPFLDAATRKAMGEQAVALAKAVGYFSAGTVEFIVDGSRKFYFLEMNTRLQVEHPVTELITGLDLVEEMIRVAAGERLRMTQDDVKLTGWAVESRLYAEDPYRSFLPSIGRLTRYQPPLEGKREDGTVVRNDTGVFEGGEISMYYDPMIAKLCTWAPDRLAAIEAMSKALDDFEVDGIGHNLPFLSAVMEHPRFREGRITTAFIAEEFPDGFTGVHPVGNAARRLAAVAAFLNLRQQKRSVLISGALANHPRKVGREWVATLRDFSFALSTREEGGKLTASFDDGVTHTVSSDWLPGRSHATFLVDGVAVGVKTAASGGGWRLRQGGIDEIVHVRSPRVAELAGLMPKKQPPDTSKMLLCPMPGVVTTITVGEGETVEAGQALATVEAMKMENVLRAERRGVVKRVAAQAGESLAVDELIIEFE
ncbi:acetyl/propionyl/methylcrotonyl-CoA carboxylase subunit alpha [Aminobacter sp. MDW-2]|uniref:acetyl-CoA carboxylase biotin carboxylase subunit n=1 Tax=Aminobacter sp. MDW-2 TaxID=2666139 RepID=UPI0013122743|nr:acetyl/propionyl/methylcrotonyl-CoA carboxylase subunit alpha [Aminobacter sp. MDW-2]MRX37567.1 ATP-grasp domain-containing protein [Aminobacter sp. MDW-2]QNH37970.1 acetyl/propionyl/methylcrotonyl-CoA carboxylase subunit alpha [Aminobacter sp. MDW-2]